MQRLADYQLRGIATPEPARRPTRKALTVSEARRLAGDPAAAPKRRRAPAPARRKPSGKALPEGSHRLKDGGRRVIGEAACAADIRRKLMRRHDAALASLREFGAHKQRPRR